MSTINELSSDYSSALTSSAAADVSMGKEDFLKLLVAQLQNQDPMNPSDPTEFTAQLAQFSQLEQLTNVNESLTGLSTMSTDMQRMSALGMIGQEVTAQTDQFHYSGDAVELGYRMELPAEEVKLYVLSQSGATLATINASETGAGEHFVSWDGLGLAGLPLEEGDYTLVIRALDGDDELVSSLPLIRGQVQGVDMTGSATELETSAGIFAMGKIERAGNAL